MLGSSIAENLKKIETRMRAACGRAGREMAAVQMIAVSKTQSFEKIAIAMNAGQKQFGENYVQEALAKVELAPVAQWHFIGALQSNKAKNVVGKFSLIHSVDRISLLEALGKKATELGIKQNILIEVNIADEERKAGLPASELESFMVKAGQIPSLCVLGLMCMPPFDVNPENSRRYFRKLKELMEPFRAKGLNELSMGTSQDFEVAIEEGATLIRVGTEIFGVRS
jgi:pyridoxal phosphate enzyme (YggS family)